MSRAPLWKARLGAVLAVALPAAAALAAPGAPVTNDEHILTTVAPGVFAIRHKRAAETGALCGNTTVVVGERQALVVDSCGAPSFARADLEQIRRWTDKPIRYLVNSHWHGDHTWGNSAYAEAAPGLVVVAHRETARRMAGYLPHFATRTLDLPARVRKLIETGRSETGETFSAADLDEFRANMPSYEARAEEFKSLVLRLPDLTFDRQLDLDLGDRPVRLSFLGRGNTSGDVVVELPRERIVVAGDLLVYPFPFLIGGFPREWSRTLDAVAALGAETIVPGHGAVLSGDEAERYLTLVRDLLATVARLVERETFRLGNDPSHLAEVLAAVAGDPETAALRARFAAADPGLGERFDGGLQGVVAAAYREVWGD